MVKLPTHTQCMELLDEHDVPDRVRKHSFAVNKVAVFLAKKLKEKGIKIDVKLVDRASLLHDLDKMKTLHTGNHGEETYRILSEKGFERVGYVAKKHFIQDMADKELTFEGKVLNYSDKRCQEDVIVPLKERFEYARKRYSSHVNEKFLKGEKAMYRFEEEIFRKIGLDPAKLGDHIEAG